MIGRSWPIPALVLGVAAATVAAQEASKATQPSSGQALYDKYCSQCHGVAGDGQGVAAPLLEPRPRDFTAGKFKIRTTPSGAIPTREDLKAIIQRGMPYTSMPAWPDFTDSQLESLVDHVQSFSPRFADPEQKPQPIDITSPPKLTEESVAEGRKVYEELGCAGCHGELGRGDGPSAPTLQDDWGQPLRVADLTQRWTFRGGARREDIFRAFSTGLNGTPMPSYFDSLEAERRWQLTDYIASLGPESPDYDTLVQAPRVAQELDLADPELFAGAAEAYFPVVGQIMQPGRAFHPAVNGVLLRAVYNRKEIAIELRWHDLSAERAGRNAPDIAVPLEEEQTAPAAGGGGGEDFWGEAAAPAAAEATDSFWGEGEAASGGEFSDAVALQFPQQSVTGSRKPYFLFGDAQNPVDLWFLDLAAQGPGAYVGRGSDSLQAQDAGDLTTVAAYDRGEWRVVFRRPLRSPGGASFAEGQFVPLAVSVWDGLKRERGNRRGLTAWQWLYLAPGERPSVVGPMLRSALVVLGIEILIVALVRRHRRSAAPAAVAAQRA